VSERYNIAKLRAELEGARSQATTGIAQARYVFGYTPGITNPGPGIYTTWPACYAAMQIVGGLPKLLQVDGHAVAGSRVHMTAGTYNLDNLEIVSADASGQDVFVIDDGVTIVARTLTLNDFLTVECDALISPWTMDSDDIVSLYAGSTILSAVGKAPLIAVSPGATPGIFAAFQATIGGNATPVATVGVGANLEIAIGNGSGVTAHALAGLGQATVVFSSDSNVLLPQAVTTLTLVQLSSTTNESYVPAVVANWSGTAPSSVANALDRIAAKIGPIA